MKKFLSDFRTFAVRGNIVDLAVAVIIGGAFGGIVTSFVNDLIMPIIAAVFTIPDFTALTVHVNGTPIMIGNFIQAVVNFIIVAFSVFLMIRALSKLKKKEEPKTEVKSLPTGEEVLLAEIRDLLKERR